MTVAERIRRVLAAGGLTYSEGARLFGVRHHATMRALCDGRRAPDVDVMDRLSDLEAMHRAVPALYTGLVQRYRVGYESAPDREARAARREWLDWLGSVDSLLGYEPPERLRHFLKNDS